MLFSSSNLLNEVSLSYFSLYQSLLLSLLQNIIRTITKHDADDDFLNSPEKQEQVLDEYLKSNYGQLKNKGSLNYLGTPMQGVVNNFDITNTGLLAASHREGAGAVNNYLKHLVKNQNGRYYIDYGNMSDKDLSDMFRRIETRLRNFEK